MSAFVLFMITSSLWMLTSSSNCAMCFCFSHRPSRNLSEKKRRDKLNVYISELAAMVPSCASAQRKLDKTTVLKMTVGYMKVHNGKIHYDFDVNNRWAWALVPTKLLEPGTDIAWGGGIHGNPVSGPPPGTITLKKEKAKHKMAANSKLHVMHQHFA